MADVSVTSGSTHIVVAETHLNNDPKIGGASEPNLEDPPLIEDANGDKSKSETPNDAKIRKDSNETDVVVDLEQTVQAPSKEDASPASDSQDSPQATSQITNHKNVERCVSDSEVIRDVPSKRKQSITPVDLSFPSTSKQNASETLSAPATSSSRKGLKGILKTRSESQIILNMPILNADRQNIIGKFSNGTSVDDGSTTGVRFELETELSGTTNTKRKRKSGRSKEPKIASFINPAFEQEDQVANYKFSDLVEQLLGHGTDDQNDSHPYGRKACRLGNNGSAFMDSGKPMIWFVLMVVMLSAIGGIIFLSETRKRIPVYLTNITISASTSTEPSGFL